MFFFCCHITPPSEEGGATRKGGSVTFVLTPDGHQQVKTDFVDKQAFVLTGLPLDAFFISLCTI